MPRHKDIKSSADESVAQQPTKYNGSYNEKYRGLPAEIRLMIWKLLTPPKRLRVKSLRPTDKDSAVRCNFNDSPGLILLGLDRTIRAEVLPLYEFTIDLTRLNHEEALRFFFRSPAEVSPLVNELVLRHNTLEKILLAYGKPVFQDLSILHIPLVNDAFHNILRYLRKTVERLDSYHTGIDRGLLTHSTEYADVRFYGRKVYCNPDQIAWYEKQIVNISKRAGYTCVIKQTEESYEDRYTFEICLKTAPKKS